MNLHATLFLLVAFLIHAHVCVCEYIYIYYSKFSKIFSLHVEPYDLFLDCFLNSVLSDQRSWSLKCALMPLKFYLKLVLMAYVHFLIMQFIKLFQIGCSLIKHLKIDSNQVKANCQVFFSE